MARRYINTAQFNPYSFQEIWEPALAATQAHQQQAQALMTLEMQNAYLGSQINPDLDPEEYARYKSYEQRMQQTSRDLLERGLSTNSFNNLYGMSIDYTRNIHPIEESVNNRKEYYKTINATLTEHPEYGLIGSLEKPLREFRNGIPRTELVNGVQIQNDVALLAQAYGKSLTSMTTEEYSQLRDLVTTKTGLDWDELLQQLQQSDSPISTIINSVLQKHGVTDNNHQSRMNSPAEYQKMLRYAQNGAYGAIGTKTPQIVANDVQGLHTMRNQDSQLALQTQNALTTQKNTELNTLVQLASLGLIDSKTLESGLKDLGFDINSNTNNSNTTSTNDLNEPIEGNLYPNQESSTNVPPTFSMANRTYKATDVKNDWDYINKITNGGTYFSEHKNIFSKFSNFTTNYLMKHVMGITNRHNLTTEETKQLYTYLKAANANHVVGIQQPKFIPSKHYDESKCEAAYRAIYNTNNENHILIDSKKQLPKPTDVKNGFTFSATDEIISKKDGSSDLKIRMKIDQTYYDLSALDILNIYAPSDQAVAKTLRQYINNIDQYKKMLQTNEHNSTVVNNYVKTKQAILALIEQYFFHSVLQGQQETKQLYKA